MTALCGERLGQRRLHESRFRGDDGEGGEPRENSERPPPTTRTRLSGRPDRGRPVPEHAAVSRRRKELVRHAKRRREAGQAPRRAALTKVLIAAITLTDKERTGFEHLLTGAPGRRGVSAGTAGALGIAASGRSATLDNAGEGAGATEPLLQGRTGRHPVPVPTGGQERRDPRHRRGQRDPDHHADLGQRSAGRRHHQHPAGRVAYRKTGVCCWCQVRGARGRAGGHLWGHAGDHSPSVVRRTTPRHSPRRRGTSRRCRTTRWLRGTCCRDPSGSGHTLLFPGVISADAHGGQGISGTIRYSPHKLRVAAWAPPPSPTLPACQSAAKASSACEPPGFVSPTGR